MNTKTFGQGTPNIHRIVIELWERAADGLSERELQWFAKCSDHASSILSCMADTTERMGCMVKNDGGRWMDKGALSLLLFNLADSMNGVNALLTVSSMAHSRLLRVGS